MKRFFVFLLALAACAALLCAAVGAEDVPANVNWTEISTEAELRTQAQSPGTHYVKVTQSFDVTKPNNIYVYGDLTLDLNGCTITLRPPTKEVYNGYAMFVVGDEAQKIEASFTLMDSSLEKTGKLTFAYLGQEYQDGEETKTCRAGAVSLKMGSTFTMKSGTIERFGGTYSLSVINLGRPNTTFNMEGGVIQNCTTPNGLGGIVVGITSRDNTFNMTGGEIKDCATGGVGVIYASNATIHIGGSARITNNKSRNGGAFYVKNGTRLTIDGSAVIEGNESAQNGGAIYACTGSETGDKPSAVEIGGSAQIRGNKATGYGKGGAIYAMDASITMTGGTISANSAANGSHEVYLAGSNAQSPSVFTMSGGKIEHTTAASGSSPLASFQINANSELRISNNAEITLSGKQYAFDLIDTGKLTATGGTVIASGTVAAMKLGTNASVNPEKAATFAGADEETAAFVTYPDIRTYMGNKYVKLVPGWTLTLDSNGHGASPDPIIVPKNYRANIEKLQDTADGYLCTGWYYDRACTRMYEREPFTQDTTLYAGWVKKGDFGLRISGWKEEDGKNILQYDDVTYGTPAANENQTKTFTIQNIGSETLEVALYTTSGAPHNQFYFERGTKLIQAVELEPGEVRTVYAEYSIPSYYNPLWQDVSKPRIDGPYPITVTAKNDASKTRTYEFYMKRQLIRATASLETPTLATSSYPYGTKLGDIDITPPAGWSWVDGENVRLPAGTTSARACYTLNDDEKLFYDWSGVEGYDAQTQTVTRDIALTITKGNAPTLLFSFTPPENLIYDGNPKEATVTALNAPAGYARYTGTITVLYNGSMTPPTDAGTYQISLVLGGDGNYNACSAQNAVSDAQNWRFTIAPATVALPTAVSGLVYNGETQTGVALPEGAHYTLRNNTAKNAGDYTATASLTDKKNYAWPDGTSEDKQIDWSIAKAAPGEITVIMQGFACGSTPPTPTLSANPGNAQVRFYYTGEKQSSGGTLWSANEGRKLLSGTYYIYAELEESTNYTAYTTAPTAFSVYSLAAGVSIRVAETEHGRIQAPPSALPGSTVPVRAEPNTGYLLGSLRVTDANGKRIPVTKKADGSYTFLMPNSTVCIEAEFVSGNPFVDVPASAWYADAVCGAWANGLIDGVDKTHFRPDGSLTVAQAIKLAAALHQRLQTGEVTLENGSPWYRSYLEYAVTNGIVEEAYLRCSAEALNAPVQRDEFAHILYGAAKSYTAINEIGADALPDVKTGDRYAAEIYMLYRAGVLTGSDRSGTFYPASSLRRSEAAAILIRAFDESARRTVSLQ